MKLLMTGATGLIGKQLVHDLHAKGYDVNYLTTSKSKIENTDNYNGFYWNPAKGEIDTACFEGVSAIINLAGSSIAQRWTLANKKLILESRVDSLNTLRKGLENYGSAGVNALVSASAIGIYPSSFSNFYDETCEKVDQSFLGEVVQAWESATEQFEEMGIKVAKIRIGLVLSINGGALPQMAQPIKNYIGAPLGSGQQWQSWVHIEDVSRIFQLALEQQLNGIYNAVAPNPVVNTKLTKSIAEVLKRPILLPNVPSFMLKLIFGKMAYVLLASQRVSSKKVENEGFSFNYSNLNHALESFYKPKQEKETIEAFAEEKYI